MANKNKGYFGKLVIGEEAYEAEQKIVAAKVELYGPHVTDKHPTDEPAPAATVVAVIEEAEEAEEPPEDVSSLSVREIRDEVKGDVTPALIDRLMRDEFFRAGGPRKSVLEILRSKEAGRDDPRAEVVEALEGKIEELE